jgi:hypothetical protein
MAFFQIKRGLWVDEGQLEQRQEVMVPTSYELIMEFISGFVVLTAGELPGVSLELYAPDQSSVGTYYFPLSKVGTEVSQDRDGFILSQPIRVHADPGSKIVIVLQRIGTAKVEVGDVTITGELLDAGSSGPSVAL